MIEVSHLVKSYRDLKAVQDLSFEVKSGEILGFLGPNGAGKTTTMRILTGVLPPTSGTAKICGFDVFEQPLEVKKRIGYLPETPPLYPEMTVRDYLRFVARLKSVPKKQLEQEVERTAAATHCDIFIERVIGNLSKGQRQRVGLSQALLGNPEVLILDEPTVGLDIKSRRGMWAQIESLAARGKTVLLTTHYLEEADSLAHRIVVIDKGHIVCEGTPAEVKSLGSTAAGASKSRSVKVICCATAIPANRLLEISGVTSATLSGEITTLITSQSESTLRELLALDPSVHSIEVQSPKLEDAFLALTNEHE